MLSSNACRSIYYSFLKSFKSVINLVALVNKLIITPCFYAANGKIRNSNNSWCGFLFYVF